MAKRRKKIVGDPRTHKNPVTKWQHYENELAKRQYSDPVVLVATLAKKKRIIVDPSRCNTQIRSHGGVVVKTRMGDTTTPHIVDLIVDYIKRKNRMMGGLRCTKGLIVHHDEFEDRLKRGGTAEHVSLAKRCCRFFKNVTRYAEREEAKQGLRHLRPGR